MKIITAYDHLMATLPHAQCGQALIELAVLGSVIFIILSTMLAYGLRFNYDQKMTIAAYKKAEQLARSPAPSTGDVRGSASVMMLADRHIPDFTQAFGKGQVMPFIGASSVTRDNQLDKKPDNYDELPSTFIYFVGKNNANDVESQPINLKTTGIRTEIVPKANMKSYKFIYGTGNLRFNADNKVCLGRSDGRGLDCAGNPQRPGEDCVANPDDCGPYNDPSTCDPRTDPGCGSRPTCACQGYRVKVFDKCEGEIFDRQSCIVQARQIVDVSVLREVCEKSKMPGDDINCNSLGGVRHPWYVEGYYLDPAKDPATKQYIFPLLDAQFAYNGRTLQNFGLQNDVTIDEPTSLTMQKRETANRGTTRGGITTTDTFDWSSTSSRPLIYHDRLDKSTGESRGSGTFWNETIQDNSVVQDWKRTWANKNTN